MTKRRIGERLLEAGLITERQLAQALQAQQATGEQLGTLLTRMGYVGEDDLLRNLCEDAGIPFSNLADRRPEPAALELIPEGLARERSVLPLAVKDGRILIAASDPFDFNSVQALERTSGLRVALVGTPRSAIQGMIEEAYRGRPRASAAPAVEQRAPAPEPRPAPQAAASGQPRGGGVAAETSLIQRFERVTAGAGAGEIPGLERTEPPAAERGDATGTAAQMADEIFQRGVAMGATDIHIEPEENDVMVRYRVDGILRAGPTYPKAVQAALITRIKVISGLNIAENRLPQDGRVRIQTAGRDVDLRISTFPTLHGEDLVLRVLDTSRIDLNIARLGMAQEDADVFRDIIIRPHGIILITGPTGSGKTTTLYAALSELNNGTRCVLTLEDPIEYELAGIRQSQINARAGLTFASGLRALLRHDPDVILVGEMRDQETVQIGLSAAMTGHLVLSTLHTNTAAGAIPRLLDMGAEPFVIASTLQLSVAQRLIRRICSNCAAPAEVPDEVRRRFGVGDAELLRGRGCGTCSNTGYKGRVGIYELLPVTETVAAAIYERKSADEIQRASGRKTLLDDGLAKVRAGVTTLDEVLRAVSG